MAERTKILQVIHSPLGFFVLSLLVIESFLLGAGIFFNLTLDWKIAAIGTGVFLFIGEFLTVVWLVVRHPQNLVFGEESHMKYAAMMYGTENHRLDKKVFEELQSQYAITSPIGQLAESDGKTD